VGGGGGGGGGIFEYFAMQCLILDLMPVLHLFSICWVPTDVQYWVILVVPLADQLELRKTLKVTSGICFLCWVSRTRFSVYFTDASSWQYAASSMQARMYTVKDDKNPTNCFVCF